MSKRSASYDEAIAARLQTDLEFARAVLLQEINLGTPVHEALAGVIAAMTIKGFAKLAKSPASEVAAVVNNPQPSEKLVAYLSALGCELTIRVKTQSGVAVPNETSAGGQKSPPDQVISLTPRGREGQPC